MEVTVEQLRTILKEIAAGKDVDKLDADVSLNEQGIDSVDMMDFYLNIEDEFGVPIPDADIEKLKSLNDFVAYLEGK